jgi:Taurine catabolism dioxygenase TauD, TfdA family.
MANVLTKNDDYQHWRDNKLANVFTQLEDCIVEIKNPFELKNSEKNKITSLCRQGNFAIFHISKQNDYADAIVSINTQFGLVDFDQHLYVQDKGLAHITQIVNKNQSDFIPYTDKAIGWHTDGYYNSTEQRIRAFSLFCVSPASEGGSNEWIDPQMIYLLLRENNPDVAKALTHPKTMTIPEHRVNNIVRRAKSTGPIFFIDESSNALYVRYTQRKKNIEFLDSIEIKQAVEHLDDLLNKKTDYHFQHLMQAGQGLLCNNVLHKRNSFIDDKDNPRLLLRGRYFNRIE